MRMQNKPKQNYFTQTRCPYAMKKNMYYVICFPQSTKEFTLVQKCPCISGSNWNLGMLVLRRGENRSTRRKTSQSGVENQQQTQPTYDTGSGNRTWDTLVGTKRYHHSAIPAPFLQKFWKLLSYSPVEFPDIQTGNFG